jgi:kynurenine formamidase
MNNPRWKIRPEGSTWGDFGPDDQLGRLNLLTPHKVKQGVAEVREGLAFCLSLPLDYPGGSVLNPSRKPPLITPTYYDDGKPRMNFPLAKFDANSTDIVCDDQVLLSLQYSTQWDSLAHIGARFDADGGGVEDMVYYNGYRANDHIAGPHDYDGDHECGGPFGAKALGIENMAQKAIQGRAVLVDLHAHFGYARKAIGYDDFMRVMQADKVEIESGDMLVLHTGFTHLIMQMNRQPDKEIVKGNGLGLDGRDEKLLQWITDIGIAAVCADNYAVEHYPANPPLRPGKAPLLPLHQHCLFKLGVPLAELWWLKDLAAWLRDHKRSRFLLTAPPLRLPGAVGSPVTPVATV